MISGASTGFGESQPDDLARSHIAYFLSDEKFQAGIRQNPRDAFADKGVELPSDLEVKVLSNSRDTFYLVLPPDPNEALSDEDLSMIAGGKSASSAGSAGSASSAGCVPSTASTAGSASSASTAASAS